MKLKFRYDYHHKMFMITLVISVGLLAATTFSYGVPALFVICLLCTVISFLNSLILIRRQGIEFDLSKGKILIIDDCFFRKVSVDKIASAEYKEIAKTNGNPLTGIFTEPRRPYVYMEDCDHTYHNGKVYQIIFHLRDGTNIESYFGWMYKERSEKVVQKVEYELYVFLKQLNEAIPWKKPFRQA